MFYRRRIVFMLMSDLTWNVALDSFGRVHSIEVMIVSKKNGKDTILSQNVSMAFPGAPDCTSPRPRKEKTFMVGHAGHFILSRTGCVRRREKIGAIQLVNR
jgi:hypothetical protein